MLSGIKKEHYETEQKDPIIDLVNYQNVAYTGPIYFTAEFQGIDSEPNFIYDTGSGALTTTSVSCTAGCSSQYYNQTKSKTAVTLDLEERKLVYGSATLTGINVEDTVCISPKTEDCVHDLKFLKITQATGFAFDGIVGMSPRRNSQSSLIMALADEKIISQPKVTFCLNSESFDQTTVASNITFGNMPNDCLHGGSDFTFKLYLDTTYDEWWSVRLRSVRYGSSNLKSSYTDIAIIDTGTSFFTISKSDFDNFAEKMLELDGLTCNYAEGCQSQDGVYCESLWPLMEDL